MSLKQKWKWIYCDHRHWYNSYKIFQNIPTYLPSFISFWLTLVCSGCVFCPPAHLRIFVLEYMLHIYTVYTCTSTYMSTEVHLYSTLNFKLGMFHKLLSLNLLPPSGWNHFPRTSLFSKLHLSSFYYYYTHTHTAMPTMTSTRSPRYCNDIFKMVVPPSLSITKGWLVPFSCSGGLFPLVRDDTLTKWMKTACVCISDPVCVGNDGSKKVWECWQGRGECFHLVTRISTEISSKR